MAPTVRDVARAAKVVPSTVSLVLNHSNRVRPETRQRVEVAIQQLGYNRHRVTTSTASDNSNSVTPEARNLAIMYSSTVIHDGQIFPLTMSWISAMRRRAGQLGHHVSIFPGMATVDQDQVYLKMIDDNEIHGLLFIGISSKNDYLKLAQSKRLPVVVMNRTSQRNEFSSVNLDNYQGGRCVGNYFLELGHRRLAIVAHEDPDTCWGRDRRDGFEDALRDQQLSPICVMTHRHNDELSKICRKIAESGVTGVFVHGDEVAVRCIDLLEGMKIKIPEQISVIGFDDVELTSKSGLRPTSVAYDKAKMGASAVDILAELIRENGAVHCMSRTVSVRISPHDTTRPVPA